MRRLICLYLVFLLLLPGCAMPGERIKEPVTFYYVRENYQKDMDCVIASEVREAAGHRNDLSYLLALYSLGPSSEELRSPLLRNTTISLTERGTDNIELTLSESAPSMSDADFTLASACIAMTCMELTEIPQITVICGDKTITIQENNLLLYNGSAPKQQEDIK